MAIWIAISLQLLLPFLFNPGSPQSRTRRRGEKEEERQDWDELENHCHRAKPNVIPDKFPRLLLLLLLGISLELKPPVVGQLAQARSSDDDERRCAEPGDQVEGQEDNELKDLYDAPGCVDGRACRLSKHLDRRGGI